MSARQFSQAHVRCWRSIGLRNHCMEMPNKGAAAPRRAVALRTPGILRSPLFQPDLRFTVEGAELCTLGGNATLKLEHTYEQKESHLARTAASAACSWVRPPAQPTS